MPVYLLDTDTLSLYQHHHPRVTERVLLAPAGTVMLSTWTIEEQVNGWSAAARSAKTPAEVVAASQLLARLAPSWGAFQILPATGPVLATRARLLRLKLNVGGYDLGIASAALEANATVVTRNRRDFGRVPGLTLEDWSV